MLSPRIILPPAFRISLFAAKAALLRAAASAFLRFLVTSESEPWFEFKCTGDVVAVEVVLLGTLFLDPCAVRLPCLRRRRAAYSFFLVAVEVVSAANRGLFSDERDGTALDRGCCCRAVAAASSACFSARISLAFSLRRCEDPGTREGVVKEKERKEKKGKSEESESE